MSVGKTDNNSTTTVSSAQAKAAGAGTDLSAMDQSSLARGAYGSEAAAKTQGSVPQGGAQPADTGRREVGRRDG